MERWHAKVHGSTEIPRGNFWKFTDYLAVFNGMDKWNNCP